MKMRTLGGTGIKVSPLCLGAMMFGGTGNPDHDDCVAIIHKALAGGKRDEVAPSTKFHGAMGRDPNQQGNSRRWIVREVENSLRRLQTDYIDLYQMHRPDPDTDIDETLSALSDLIHAGKIRAVGSSTFPAESIVEAQWVEDRRGHVRCRSEQPPDSIFG